LSKPDYDILIIGGGIYGCGIAQAAAAAGYRVCLHEQSTIASGTSSQSTKLIHGGLRYLEQGNLKLVYEALAEREVLLKIAPALVQRQWFYIPVYRGSKRPPWLIACGLFLYWLLSFGRSRFRRLPRRRWQAVLPGLNTDGLQAVLAYEDAATDDAALTRAVAASAVSFGCAIVENSRLESAEFDGQCWQAGFVGQSGEDQTSGDQSDENQTTCSARILINAGGPWIHEVCQRIRPAPPEIPVRLAQGSHLLLDRPCPAYIYTESLDGRVMFFRPWQGKLLAGTTETRLDAMTDHPQPTRHETQAILSTCKHYFPDTPCSEADILKSYCGVRVLPAGEEGAFAASRETVLLADEPDKPCYIGIYGGKLTTYRQEAGKVLRLIARHIPQPNQADTRRISLSASASD